MKRLMEIKRALAPITQFLEFTKPLPDKWQEVMRRALLADTDGIRSRIDTSLLGIYVQSKFDSDEFCAAKRRCDSNEAATPHAGNKLDSLNPGKAHDN
ncbi:MAG: hypothetical protein HYR96_03720 [Deltaproteobacteria bacterium]|nr:hypothetical protein [Deltaproteobacteria bacterium]MBI3295225.1 hypothetical protein [Deltaproteobacteria bacterium]